MYYIIPIVLVLALLAAIALIYYLSVRKGGEIFSSSGFKLLNVKTKDGVSLTLAFILEHPDYPYELIPVGQALGMVLREKILHHDLRELVGSGQKADMFFWEMRDEFNRTCPECQKFQMFLRNIQVQEQREEHTMCDAHIVTEIEGAKKQ